MKNKKKKLLILGAGPDQLPMYKTAKKLNLAVIGADAKSDSVAKKYCDTFLTLSNSTGSGILKALESERPDAIVSPGNDSFHRSKSFLSEKLNLKQWLNIKAIEASCNKNYFCKEASKSGIFAPTGYKSNNKEHLKMFAKRVSYPVMIKPNASSGNKGVSYVHSDKELTAAIDNAFVFSQDPYVRVEQYIDGQHGGIEVFRLAGKTILTAISYREHSGKPDFLTLKHVIQLDIPSKYKKMIVDSVDRICDHFSIHNGPVNFDFVLQDDRVVFLEMGARLSGNGFPSLVKQCFGLDTYELSLKLEMGTLEPSQFKNIAQEKAGAIAIIASKQDGKFVGFSNDHLLTGHPSFVTKKTFVQQGEQVHKFSQANHKLGYFLFSGTSDPQLKDALDCFDQSFSIHTK